MSSRNKALRRSATVLLAATTLLAAEGVESLSTPYPATIDYRETITRIAERGDVRWAGVPGDDYLDFQFVTASEDGARVFFNVYCPYCPVEAGYINRPFIADGDGSNLVDVSDIFPGDLVSSSWGWGNMRIDDDGSRVFIKSQGNTGVLSLVYRENSTAQTARACSNDLYPSAFDWFSIDATGDRVYLGKYDTGWDETLGHYRRGLYYSPLGAAYQWYLDIYDLPCTDQCGNLNMLGYMGSAAEADRSFFVWNSGQASNACSGDGCLHNALWYTDLAGNAAKVTNEEHYWVRGGDWHGTATADGEKVLYINSHLPGDPQRLYLVDIPNGSQQLLTWTNDLNGYPDYHLTPSGRYAMIRGGNGDWGYHYITRFDTDSLAMRDTWSYWLAWTNFFSNVASDRYYFATHADTLYRIDMSPATAGGYATDAPSVATVSFSDIALLDDDGAQIGVSVRVTDPQGTANIEWVRLLVLVDGLEEPAFSMGREPLAFPSGDAGSTLLYDDGTHGDTTAGDGWFSFDAIATRKGDYDGMNTWFQQFALPHEVGIRILAKDLDGNYAMGDTTLLITDEACSSNALTFSGQTLSSKRTLCSSVSVQLGPDLSVAAGSDLYVKAPLVKVEPYTQIEPTAQVRMGQ